MKIGSFMTVFVAAGLAATPIAAQAGTKASAAVVAPVEYGSRASTAVAAKHKLVKSSTVLLGGAVVAVVLGVVALSSGEGDSSRG